MQSSSLEGSWVAVQVRTAREIAVAEQLAIRGYESFVPLYTRQLSGRRKRVGEVLFSGYVFCRYRTRYEFRIVETPWVISIVGIRGVPQIISEEEMEAVRAVVRSGLPPERWDSVPTGTRVRVCSGPLCGLEGYLVEVRNGARLLISIPAIQKHIAVEVQMPDVTLVRNSVIPYKNKISSTRLS